MIVLYDTAFSSKIGTQRIMAHELIHQVYVDLPERERQDYRRAAGWALEMETDGNLYYYGRKTGYVEEDGKISPEEDYANNMEYFIFSPDKLKTITPNAYGWFSKKYGEKLKLKGNKK